MHILPQSSTYVRIKCAHQSMCTLYAHLFPLEAPVMHTFCFQTRSVCTKCTLPSNVLILIPLRQRMITGPGHRPRVDVEELAPCPGAPLLVALPPGIERSIPPQGGWNRSVLPHRRQRQAAEDRRHRNNVGDGFGLGLVHLLRAPVRDPSPPRRSPAGECAHGVLSTRRVCSLHTLCTLFGMQHTL